MVSSTQATVGSPHPSEGESRRANRRLDVQGLRAVAVLMVVAFHAGLPVPGGFVGVDVFFVISGFVITAMLMREHATTRRIRLGRFYVRRFKRLTPALALMVGVVMAASLLLLSPLGSQQTAAKTALGAMLLSANVVIARTTGHYFDAPAESNPLLNTWSLSVEEQFYLVFPTVLLVGFLLAKRTRRSLAPVVVVGMVGAVSLALALAGSFGLRVPFLPNELVGFYGPATRAWEFAVGALLALGGARLAVPSNRIASSLGLVGAAMLIASLWLITGTTPFPGVWTLLPVTGTLLLIAAGSRGVLARALASGPMVAIGDRSYSIYLWHWPFVVFARLLWPEAGVIVLAAAALSFVPAYASYRWVEQPVRALPLGRGVALARLVAGTLVPPLALAGGLGLAVGNGFWDSSVRNYQAVLPSHAGATASCTHKAWQKPTDCTWNGGAAGKPIYLVGDSNADQFSEALIGASKALARPLVSLTEDGCSYLPVSIALSDSKWDSRCAPYTGKTEHYLVTAQPGTVIIANAYLWFLGSSTAAIGPPGQPPRREPAAKLRALSAGLSAAVRTLHEAGHAVLLVQAVPHWGDRKESLTWATCSVIDMVTVGCARTMSMETVLDRQGAEADVVASVASSGGTGLLDLSSQLCPGGVCSSVAPDGLVRYRDGTHITVAQSEELTGTFEKAIASAR